MKVTIHCPVDRAYRVEIDPEDIESPAVVLGPERIPFDFKEAAFEWRKLSIPKPVAAWLRDQAECVALALGE